MEHKMNTHNGNEIIKEDGRFVCFIKEDRYHLEDRVTGAKHDIAAEPWITNEDRLTAHWDAFREASKLRGDLTMDNSTADIKKAVSKAKDACRREDHVDFVEGQVQLLAIDKDGERCQGSGDEYQERVTKRGIREIFKAYPDAVCVNLSGVGRAFNDPDAPLSDRMQDAEQVEWWEVNVFPEDQVAIIAKN